MRQKITVWDRYFHSDGDGKNIRAASTLKEEPREFNGHKWVVDFETMYGVLHIAECEEDDGVFLVSVPEGTKIEERSTSSGQRFLRIDTRGLENAETTPE
jgi:hypothetical protein